MTGKILIVDDIPLNLRMIQKKLEEEYYSVFTASGGREALSIIHSIKPDIVLVDAVMPDIDGFKVIQRIKNTPEIAHIPVIMITALNGRAERNQGLLAGADDFLSKPLNHQILLARIKSLLQLKSLSDSLNFREKTLHKISNIFDSSEENTIRMIKTAKILIAESDSLNLNFYHKMLSRSGFNTTIISNSNLVVQTLLDNSYNLCIIGNLNGMDNLLMCSRIKSEICLRNLPLLVIMKTLDEVKLSKAFEIGVHDYVIEPVDEQEMIARCIMQIKKFRYYQLLKETCSSSFIKSAMDQLTSLYNRRYLENYINHLINEKLISNKFFMLLDVDNFKSINDNYGHSAGDTVLTKIAQNILTNVKITDCCARIGGDEFAMLIDDANLEILNQIATRINSSIHNDSYKIIDRNGNEAIILNCTCSIGGTKILNHDVTVENIISRADKNMYQAKMSGKNKIVIT